MNNVTLKTTFGDISVSTEDGGGYLTSSIGEDAIESLILAHACAGVDISSPAYLEGVNTALDAISNED
jgi:hypothetical protein